MKFDLHIHSCLSPCANLEMSPGEIVARAKQAGMDGIALTDHQSARNCPAIAECAKRAGLKCLYGLEVQTAEEVHTVALFDTVEQALAMTDFVYAAMPKRVNDPETFGDQPVVTWDDDIVELEWRILAMGCRHFIPETAAKVHELGGLYIAAHIDRPNFSVLGTLGAIPENAFDAVELSRTADDAEKDVHPEAVFALHDLAGKISGKCAEKNGNENLHNIVLVLYKSSIYIPLSRGMLHCRGCCGLVWITYHQMV